MPEQTIYRTPHGEKVLLDIYHKQLAALQIEHEMRNVETRFGKTNVLVAGVEGAKPLAIFHGGNSTNPYNLNSFLPLLRAFKVYAPDTMGHPGQSAQRVLSSRDESYGQWAADVIKELSLERVGCIGTSYGGGILIRLATYNPEVIGKAAFIVPSGIANSSLLNILIQLGVPMVRYRLFPSRENLIRAVKPMSMTDDVDEDTLEMVEAVFKHVKVKSEMPRNATREELTQFTAPTLVIAAENDVLFPGSALIERAKNIFPNLVQTEMLSDTPHMFTYQTPNYDKVNNLLMRFFQDDGGMNVKGL